MKFACCSSCTIFWNFRENLSIMLGACNIQCDHLTLEQYLSCQHPQHPKRLCFSEKQPIFYQGATLMIIISNDWNRVGFAAGSSTEDANWNVWNSSEISRDKAKLFLKSIWNLQSAHLPRKWINKPSCLPCWRLQYLIRPNVCPPAMSAQCYEYLIKYLIILEFIQ